MVIVGWDSGWGWWIGGVVDCVWGFRAGDWRGGGGDWGEDRGWGLGDWGYVKLGLRWD